MELIVVRHGQTHWNEVGRYQGQSDLPLSAEGRREATTLSEWLPDLADPGLPLWSSDLQRARETALLAFPGASLRDDSRLRELHFGIFEGETSQGNLERHGDGFRRWMEDPERYPPPGGETPSTLEARVRRWLLEEGGRCVVVTHGGPARVLMSLLCGLSTVEAWAVPLPPGAVVALRHGTPPRRLGHPSHPRT